MGDPGCTAADRKALQGVTKKSSAPPLPSLQDATISWRLTGTRKIQSDVSHPGLSLFIFLHSGRRLKRIKSKTNHLKTGSPLQTLPSIPCLIVLLPLYTCMSLGVFFIYFKVSSYLCVILTSVETVLCSADFQCAVGRD